METKTVHQNNDQDIWEPIDFVLGMSGSKKIFLPVYFELQSSLK